jgi:hypothetical protein
LKQKDGKVAVFFFAIFLLKVICLAFFPARFIASLPEKWAQTASNPKTCLH